MKFKLPSCLTSLRTCVRNLTIWQLASGIFFRKNVISGDIIVSYTEKELLECFVETSRSDEKYLRISADNAKYLEWRLERFF